MPTGPATVAATVTAAGIFSALAQERDGEARGDRRRRHRSDAEPQAGRSPISVEASRAQGAASIDPGSRAARVATPASKPYRRRAARLPGRAHRMAPLLQGSRRILVLRCVPGVLALAVLPASASPG